MLQRPSILFGSAAKTEQTPRSRTSPSAPGTTQTPFPPTPLSPASLPPDPATTRLLAPRRPLSDLLAESTAARTLAGVPTQRVLDPHQAPSPAHDPAPPADPSSGRPADARENDPDAAPAALGVRAQRRDFAAHGLLYVTLFVLGRLTVPDGAELSAIWPAAGAAVLWMLGQRTPRGRAAVVLGILASVATLLALGAVTGHAAISWRTAAVTLVAGLVQTLVATALLDRSEALRLVRGEARAAQPDTPSSSLRVVLRVGAALLVASLAGALVAGAGYLLTAPDTALVATVTGWARQVTGLLVVAGLVLLLRVQRTHGRTVRGELHDLRTRAAGELAVVSALTAGAYLLTVGGRHALLFLALLPVLWTAARFSAVLALLNALVYAGFVTVMTALGQTAFTDADTAVDLVVDLQLFLLTMLTVTLVTSAITEDRRRLLDALVRRDRERAERLELLGQLTESMGEPVLVLDAERRVVLANAAARTFLGPGRTVLDSDFSGVRLRHPDGTLLEDHERPSVRALLHGSVPAHDLLVHDAAGRERVVSVTSTRLDVARTWGGSDRALLVMSDVTDDRDRSRRLAEFASVAAHDLRSPLATARGWTELASGDLALVAARAGGRDEAIDEAIRLVEEATAQTRSGLDRMGDLVTDLLQQAVAESGSLQPVVVPVSDEEGPLADLLDEVSLQAEIHVGRVPDVEADAALLSQLLRNLVGNAIKYVSPGVMPVIRISGRRIGDRVVLELEDNGIGVPEAYREAIFTRFTRAHADDPHYTGTGLGLSLCRTIVERHGGSISCRAARSVGGTGGPGSRFVLDLPAAQSQDGPAARTDALEHRSGPAA
ncbi:ATP-binding protein [Nocardioides sp. GY 10127]|uniref:ATP-binding protein n=1 Tax=Nocardioides sp. GY 10127 TaxID=2569762 RepID=UPI0010A7F29E|nr:ATP-binding protein [Nocardioides sp. GY 10127]TIC79347.1 hypothetical protein E8D37_17275 [Nocardioides sp. GY 10127]